MIRIKLRQLLDEKGFREGRKITLNEVSERTGIGRATLNRIVNQPTKPASTATIDALCEFLDCEPGELLEHLSDERGHRKKPKKGDRK